jgi:hypothetical protein
MYRQIQGRYLRWRTLRDERWVKRWAESRKKGLVRFITLFGLVGWALPMVGITLAAGLYTFPKSDWPFALKVWLGVVPLALALGAAYGGFMWLVLERAYKRLTRNASLATE